MNTRLVTSLPYTELNVADGNFDKTRAPIDRIIIHTMVGTWQGAAARFNDPKSQVSAHYGIKLDGGIIHWLEETFTAYHAGNYPMNQRSIGIEHEDGWNGKDPEPTRPEALYTASANLVREICLFYNIPIDRKHILKHNEVSDKPTGCCDALDIDRIVKEASGATDPINSDTLPVKKTDFESLVLKSSEYDKFTSAGYFHLEDVLKVLNDKDKSISNLTSDVNVCETHVNDYLDELKKLNEEDKNISTELLLAQQSLQPLKDEISAACTALGIEDGSQMVTAIETLKKSKIKPQPKPVTLIEKLKFLFG